MSVQYPSHLYIRIDRPLRADLLSAAEAAGQSVSAFARGVLRGSISQGPTQRPRTVAVRPIAATISDKTGPMIFHGTVHQAKDGDA